MTCKFLSRGRVSNCCFTILCQGQVPHKHCKHKLNTHISFLPSPPLGPISDFSQLSSCLLGIFFCCSSVSKNVTENKLTGQTAPRFPLTRAMWNDVFSSQQPKALDVRKELDYKDFILQFYIWLKMSPNSCIMRRPFGLLASSLLAHNARFWRYRYRCGDDKPLGKNSPSVFLASALSIEKSYSCFTFLHNALEAIPLHPGLGGGRRGAGITRKEGNVPAKASHYTEAKQHFFTCRSSRG